MGDEDCLNLTICEKTTSTMCPKQQHQHQCSQTGLIRTSLTYSNMWLTYIFTILLHMTTYIVRTLIKSSIIFQFLIIPSASNCLSFSELHIHPKTQGNHETECN